MILMAVVKDCKSKITTPESNITKDWRNVVRYTAHGLALKEAANVSVEDQMTFADEALQSIGLPVHDPEACKRDFYQMRSNVHSLGDDQQRDGMSPS